MPKSSVEKQREMNAALDAAAQSAGWVGWSDFKRAAKFGAIKLPSKPKTWISMAGRKEQAK